jgi:hypothetical protein
MKFLSLLFAVGLTSATADNTSRNLATLAQKWNITIPTFTYSSLDFDLDFGTSDFIGAGMASFSIWDEDCQEGGVSVPDTVLTGEISPITGTAGDGSGLRTVNVGVSVQPEQISAATSIYAESTNANGELSAVVTFCVRFALSTSGASPIEVNFLETIVILNVKLTDGFEIDAISVAPRDKLIRTANQVYLLEAFQCDTNMVELSTQQKQVVRNQGAIIRVCVRPDALARPDGIKMREIQSLTYTRASPIATQAAVENGAAALNGLSDLTCDPGSEVCMVETILVADFYTITGVVSGSGVGSMQFGSARRLRSSERGLQTIQDEAGSAQFDLSVETVAGEDTGASGASSTGLCAMTFLGAAGLALLF